VIESPQFVHQYAAFCRGPEELLIKMGRSHPGYDHAAFDRRPRTYVPALFCITAV